MGDPAKILIAMFIMFGVVATTLILAGPCKADPLILTPSNPIIIQPPSGLPSHAYTNSSGVTTIVPPVGLPSHLYTPPSGPAMLVPPSGLPTMIYGGGR